MRLVATAAALLAGAAAGVTPPAGAAAAPAPAGIDFAAVAEGRSADCTKGLALLFTRIDRAVRTHGTLPAPATGLVRADIAPFDIGVNRSASFEICVTKVRSHAEAEVTLRSAGMREDVKLLGADSGRRGGLVARAGAPDRATFVMRAHVVPVGQPTYSLQDPASGQFVTVEQNYPAPWDNMLRAGRLTDSAGERFTLLYTGVER